MSSNPYEEQANHVEQLAARYTTALMSEAQALGDHLPERMAGIHGIEVVLAHFVFWIRTEEVGLFGETVKAGNNPASTGELEIAITRPEAEAPQVDAPSRSAPSD